MTTQSNSSIARVPKAGEMLAAHLRRQIILGELPAGAALPCEDEKLLGFLEARDADGAQRFWRRHLNQVAKYMITDPATTVVEVLA